MGVAGRPDAELAHAADGVDGVVLPMAIAAHDEEIVRDVGLHPTAKLVAFVGEVFVGMVVALIGAIGANHGGGRNQHFPGGGTLFYSAFEPGFLFRTPDTLIRRILQFILRTVIPTVGEPDLKVTAPADGSETRSIGCHRGLLAEELLPLGEGQFAHARTRARVVAQGVMVVLEPIGRVVAIKGHQAREAEHPLPVVACEANVNGIGIATIVIDEITGQAGELRSEGGHRGIDIMALRMTTISVTLTGHHAETEPARGIGQRCGLESSTHGSRHERSLRTHHFADAIISRPRLKSGQFEK